MERINNTMKKLINNQNFKQRYDNMRQEILQNNKVRAFLHEHEDEITHDMVERSLMKLYEFSTQSVECDKCPSLGQCDNMMKGYHPKLMITKNAIDIQYERCPRKVVDEEKRKNEKLIQSIYVPKDILTASFNDLDITNERFNAVEMATEFIQRLDSDNPQKGLYFYGRFGVGKTYFLGAIANELAEKKISSLIVYVPEFLREMKSSIGDQTLNTKLDTIKKAPVLMLDDIGAETMSSWARDEVLGTVLQYRMLEKLPTFFTSNFNYEELKHHLTYSQRGEEEEMKAARIMERVKYLTVPVEIKGPNRRT